MPISKDDDAKPRKSAVPTVGYAVPARWRHLMAKEVALRPGGADDVDFARKVHHHAMRPCVEPSIGWDEADQAKRVTAGFRLNGAWVIVCGSDDVVWLKVIESENSICLRWIFILPEFQNREAGTTVLVRLRAE